MDAVILFQLNIVFDILDAVASLLLLMSYLSSWLNMRPSSTIVIMSLHEIFDAGIWQTLTPVVRAVVLNQLSRDYS